MLVSYGTLPDWTALPLQFLLLNILIVRPEKVRLESGGPSRVKRERESVGVVGSAVEREKRERERRRRWWLSMVMEWIRSDC